MWGRGRSRGASSGEDALAGAQTPAVWNPALPQMPGDLLEHAVFRLTTDEAQFLIDRLIASQPTALLTMLAREGRRQLAQACFQFLPYRAELDLAGWEENDIFAHT